MMRVLPDDRSGVPGYEQHAFKCSACNDIEQHRVFTRYGRESDAEPIPVIPPRALQQLRQSKAGPAPGFFRRVVAKICGRHTDGRAEQLKNEGAAFAGLLNLGDERVCRGCWLLYATASATTP